MISHFNAVIISLTITMLLVMVYSVLGNNFVHEVNSIPENSFSKYHSTKMPELDYFKDYELLRGFSNSVVVYPIFTQSAYEWDGIHDYYTGKCDSCLTTPIQDYYKKSFASSTNAYRILEFLDYQIIDDIELDKNPSILKKYDKVILLHNEFVTRAEFEAITQHPKVIFLYPHALTSEVKSDYDENTITLIRGPSFPDENIKNGFDWEYDNSQYFDDWSCNEWNFYEIPNGFMLNCYPETELPHYGHDILETVKVL